MRKTIKKLGSYISFGLIFLLVACDASSSYVTKITPISTIVTNNQVYSYDDFIYASRFIGIWAEGYPYPIFFINSPIGQTQLKLLSINYTNQLIGESHPALENIELLVITPQGKTYKVSAIGFEYNKERTQLLRYSASVNGVSIDTQGYDVSLVPGVGLAFLGDVGGVNLFYNCVESYHLNYEVLKNNSYGRSTEVEFRWVCEHINYEVNVKSQWDENFKVGSKIIPIINYLEASILSY